MPSALVNAAFQSERKWILPMPPGRRPGAHDMQIVDGNHGDIVDTPCEDRVAVFQIAGKVVE